MPDDRASASRYRRANVGAMTPVTKAQISNIHETAIVDAAAQVPASCKIGPYCVVGPDVEVGEECELISHVQLQGPTRLVAHHRIFPLASIGLRPQYLTYIGE